MAEHLKLGRTGEELAILYLKKKGYDIHGANVRLRRDEIDIIAFDPVERMMVFVEVKTRSVSSAAYPIRTAVGAHKRKCLKRAVQRWCIRERYDGPGRIDVLCIEKDRVIDHLVDIGSPFID